MIVHNLRTKSFDLQIYELIILTVLKTNIPSMCLEKRSKLFLDKLSIFFLCYPCLLVICNYWLKKSTFKNTTFDDVNAKIKDKCLEEYKIE